MLEARIKIASTADITNSDIPSVIKMFDLADKAIEIPVLKLAKLYGNVGDS